MALCEPWFGLRSGVTVITFCRCHGNTDSGASGARSRPSQFAMRGVVEPPGFGTFTRPPQMQNCQTRVGPEPTPQMADGLLRWALLNVVPAGIPHKTVRTTPKPEHTSSFGLVSSCRPKEKLTHSGHMPQPCEQKQIMNNKQVFLEEPSEIIPEGLEFLCGIIETSDPVT